jgi:hypothetical protein
MIRKALFLTFVLMGILIVQVDAQTLKVPTVKDVAGTLDLPEDKEGFKKDFLAALDPGKDLGISAENLAKIGTKNKSFVSDVMGIMGSSITDSEKLKKIGGKNSELTTFLTSLLGDSVAGKYLEKIKKQMGPFKTKYNLAKMFF